MRCSHATWFFVLMVSAASTAAVAAIPQGTDNPYHEIVVRNVFDLKPPPPPPSNEPPKPPAPKIALNGITTILGQKQAFLTVQAPGAKPGEPAKPLALILGEHEREGEVEVLEIDDIENTIKVNDYGEVMTIAMEKPKDSPKSAAPIFTGYSPTPNNVGGIPQAQPQGIYQPPNAGMPPGTTYVPPSPTYGTPTTPGMPTVPGMKTLPTRTLRLPQSGAAPPMPSAPAPPQ